MGETCYLEIGECYLEIEKCYLEIEEGSQRSYKKKKKTFKSLPLKKGNNQQKHVQASTGRRSSKSKQELTVGIVEIDHLLEVR